jgi:hypothetical protein
MTTLWRYARERFPLRRFLPLAAVIVLAARVSGAWPSVSVLAADLVFALALIFQFRLWDDLADREHDKVLAPDRVLVRAGSHRAFHAVLAGFWILNAYIASQRGLLSLTTLAAISSVLALWYWRRRDRSAAGDHVRLAKYPAFVIVVAGAAAAAAPERVLLAMTSIYFGLCLYEALHDVHAPARANVPLLWCETAVFGIATLGMVAAWASGGLS